MKRTKKAGRGRIKDLASQQATAMCSLDIVTGAQNLATLSPQEIFDRERPQDIQAMFKLSRNWHKQNWFVEQVNLLKCAFYNFGLRVLPQENTKSTKKKLKEWWGKPENRSPVLRNISSVWDEWHVLDSVISFWREEAAVTPYLLLPENCEYSDAMGIEKLKVRLGYKKDQLQNVGSGNREAQGAGPSLTAAEIERYSKPQIILNEEFDEYYRVVTRGRRGSGMGAPRLYRAFRTLSQCESMEVGETMLAYAGRLVVRFHHLGWEVKSGANSVKQAEYLWKQSRATPIEQFFKGRMGFAETTGNFDHKISYIWVDPKLYDNKKWATIIDRLLWWAGPVGFMMLAKTPGGGPLLQMLKAQVLEDRALVGAHMEEVINAGFNLPMPIRIAWSNRCFHDSRLAWDMVKTLMQQGPLSLTSGLEQADFDPEEERERKKMESPEALNDEYLPKFDPNHGKRPGENPGRKTGVGDHTAVK